MKWMPRIQIVLLLVNLASCGLPLGGISALRLYENELIRQTESELIAQGAFVSAAYRQALVGLRELEDDKPKYEHNPPRLDIFRYPVHPPAQSAMRASTPSSPAALEAGKAITPVLLEAKRSTLAGIRVVDAQGTVVATTGTELGESLAHRLEVRQALNGKHARLVRERSKPKHSLGNTLSRGNQLRIFVAIPITQDGKSLGAAVLSRTPVTLSAALYRNRSMLLFASLILLLLVFMVSVATSLTIGQPLKRLIKQSRQLARGDDSAMHPLKSPRTQEVQELSEALVHMASAYNKQNHFVRRLTSMIGHELKTPLTAIRGSLELLQDHGASMDNSERQNFLGIIESNSKRLNNRVQQMLVLAKTESTTFKAKAEDLEPTLEAITCPSAMAALKLDIQRPLPPAFMAAEILENILYTLIDNAHIHGGPEVQVTLRCYGEDGRVYIKLSDNGKGISKDIESRIFDSQFTTAKSQGGSGLGLAMARDLAQLFEAELSHIPTDVGATFCLNLKAG